MVLLVTLAVRVIRETQVQQETQVVVEAVVAVGKHPYVEALL